MQGLLELPMHVHGMATSQLARANPASQCSAVACVCLRATCMMHTLSNENRVMQRGIAKTSTSRCAKKQ